MTAANPLDQTIISTLVQFEGPSDAPVFACLTRPRGDGPWPSVIVARDLRSPAGQALELAERLASEGFVALVHHLAPSDEDTRSTPRPRNACSPIQAMQAAVSFLQRDVEFARGRPIGLLALPGSVEPSLGFLTQSDSIAAAVLCDTGPLPPSAPLAKAHRPLLRVHTPSTGLVAAGPWQQALRFLREHLELS